MDKIEGGYYIKARKLRNSDIAKKPPHFREIWDWLIEQANFSSNGKVPRGSCIKNIKDIQEGLAWYVGYRKQKYSQSQCENAMKWLRNAEMITTMRAEGGTLIKVGQYYRYQDIQNYESRMKAETKAEPLPNESRSPSQDSNKNATSRAAKEGVKNVKKEKEYNTIFSFWKTILNHPKAILSRDRIRLIKARLDEGHTVEDCKNAILGCKASSYHMGENDKGKVYDAINLIFRKGDKLEQFIGYHEQAEKDKSKEVII